jgi:hypothetical protein
LRTKSVDEGILESAPHNKYATNIDEYYHFMWWIESKLEHKPLDEVVQEGVANFIQEAKH